MHAFALVLLPHLEPDVEEQTRRLLEPYDMNKEVPEYMARIELGNVTDYDNYDYERERLKGWVEQDEQGLFRRSTANPMGYWDYWHIGGRWYGCLQQVSDDELSQTEVLRVNTCSVESLMREYPLLESYGVSVVITPDGMWYDIWLLDEFDAYLKSQDRSEREKGDVLRQQAWQQRVREILARYPDHIAVGLDVHS